MSSFTRQNPNPAPGDGLRDLAADLLAGIYGEAQIEHRVGGKKADAFFMSDDNMCRLVRVYVEVKDYKSPLTRQQVIQIATDYHGVIKKNSPAILLIITRCGVTADAQSFLEVEQDTVRHRTIWQLEDKSLGLGEYISYLSESFKKSGLDKYYIPSQAMRVDYHSDIHRTKDDNIVDLLSEVDSWIQSDSYKPIAILGGYGAGKTCFAKKLVSDLAEKSLSEPTRRKPILIKLGSIVDYSNLDGLLGAQFTHEFHSRGFSFTRFMNLNEAGRFVVVLDGFDEMKHAMSWAVFRGQVAQLNTLITGMSKVVLLGRPSAFLTDYEHIYVLRGRRLGREGALTRIPDWPEFIEYELAPFGDHDISRYCHDYLTHIAQREAKADNSEFDGDWVRSRATEVALIARKSPHLFGKPVHSKILVELATRRDVDLGRLKQSSSKWDLYSLFFQVVFERELDKKSRQPVSHERRKKFLQDIALWLWFERDGATGFSVDEVPETMLVEFMHEHDDKAAVLRELLAGPFIEKKNGDTFYFVHRSFGEYLVADWMAANPPAEKQHLDYSRLYSGAVVEFLADAEVKEGRRWASTLGSSQGSLGLPYLELVARLSGSYGAAASLLPLKSPWLKIFQILDRCPQPDVSPPAFVEALAVALSKRPTSEEVALLLSLLRAPFAAASAQSPEFRSEAALLIARALISCALGHLKRGPRDPYLPLETFMIVTHEARPVLRCGNACLKGPFMAADGGEFRFDWPSLWKFSEYLSASEKLSVDLPEIHSAQAKMPAQVNLAFADLRAGLSPKLQDQFDEVFVRRLATFRQLIASEIPKAVGEDYQNEIPSRVFHIPTRAGPGGKTKKTGRT